VPEVHKSVNWYVIILEDRLILMLRDRWYYCAVKKEVWPVDRQKSKSSNICKYSIFYKISLLVFTAICNSVLFQIADVDIRLKSAHLLWFAGCAHNSLSTIIQFSHTNNLLYPVAVFHLCRSGINSQSVQCKNKQITTSFEYSSYILCPEAFSNGFAFHWWKCHISK
jgi:hypothetical protein